LWILGGFVISGGITGTTAEPYLVYDINRQTIDLESNPGAFTAIGDKVFFTADEGTKGRELYVSDGTPEGTTLLKDIRPGPVPTGVNWLTAFQGSLFSLHLMELQTKSSGGATAHRREHCP